jgi:hypothetical protein
MTELMKTAMAYASAVGQFQGKIEFIKQNPEAFTREELIAELIQLSDSVNAKLGEVGH